MPRIFARQRDFTYCQDLVFVRRLVCDILPKSQVRRGDDTACLSKHQSGAGVQNGVDDRGRSACTLALHKDLDRDNSNHEHRAND